MSEQSSCYTPCCHRIKSDCPQVQTPSWFSSRSIEDHEFPRGSTEVRRGIQELSYTVVYNLSKGSHKVHKDSTHMSNGGYRSPTEFHKSVSRSSERLFLHLIQTLFWILMGIRTNSNQCLYSACIVFLTRISRP